MSGCCSYYSSSSPGGDDGGPVGNPLPDPTIRRDLREIELSEWQGRLRREIEDEDRENWNVFRRDPTSLRLDGGTFAPVADCWERGAGNWRDIRSDAAAADNKAADAEADASGAVFIMCHGAMGNCMLLQALGMGVEAYGRSRDHEFGNCDCVEVEWRDRDEIATRWRRVHSGGGGGWRSTAVAITPPSSTWPSSRGEGATTDPPSDGGLPRPLSRSSPGGGISAAFAP